MDEAGKRANVILAEMGYPDVDTDFTFENTLWNSYIIN